jgi:drug/metabolite transporter (DMT)-like permease
MQVASGSRPSWAALRGSLLGGAAFAVNMVTFFFAIHRSSIATFTVISALQPGLVMLGASRLFGERLTRWALAWTAVAIGGAGVAVLGAGAAVHTTTLGIVFSVLSLLAMTVYFFAAKRARTTMGASDYMAGVMLWSAIFVTPVALLGGGLGGFSRLGTADLCWLAVVLVGPGLAGHLLISWAVRFVPVSLSSMAMLPTTVIAIVAAWPIHHEPVTLLQGLGGVIALGGVAAVIARS